MLQDLINIVLLVVQFLAFVWAIGVALRMIFGFGLADDGKVEVKNKRGHFVCRRAQEVKKTFGSFAEWVRGKTHDKDLVVRDVNGNELPSKKEKKTQPKS